MKTAIRTITTGLILTLLCACSGNDDEKEVEVADIDPTNYILAGKFLNNHLTIITFASNNEVSIKNVDEERSTTYTVSGDTLKIANYGFVKVQNHAIAYAEIDHMEFDDARLLQTGSVNVFKDKDFTGTLVNNQFQIPFFLRFSDSGILQGTGQTFEDANPDREFNVIGNVAGILEDNFSNIFYIHNNKLIYELKIDIGQAGLQYFYNEGLNLQQ